MGKRASDAPLTRADVVFLEPDNGVGGGTEKPAAFGESHRSHGRPFEAGSAAHNVLWN